MQEQERESVSDMTDEEVLARTLKEPSFFGVLLERYQKPFVRKAFSILNDADMAEDAVQEAFTKIYINAPRFKKVPGARFSSWAYKILINTSLSYYRKQKRDWQNTVPLMPDAGERFAEEDRAFERNELANVAASLLVRLPSTLRRALRLRFLEERSYKEIAELEDITESAAKTRVYRAKQELRKTVSHPVL